MVGTEWMLMVDHLPLLVADFDELTRDAGLKLAIFEPLDSYDTIEAVADGRFDCAVVLVDQLIWAAARGRPVWAAGTLLESRMGIFAPGRSGIRTATELAGRRIGYQHAPRPWTETLLRSVLGDDVVTVDSGFDHTTALIEGTCDAVWDVFEIGDPLHPVFDDESSVFIGTEDLGLPPMGVLTLAINAQRTDAALLGSLRVLRRLLGQAMHTIRRDPDRCLELFRARKPWRNAERDRRSLHAMLPLFQPDLPLLEATQIESIVQGLADRGLVSRLPPERFVPPPSVRTLLGAPAARVPVPG